MSNGTVASNRHLVDQLADAKAELDAAKSRYETLRDRVLASGETEGDEFVAVVQTRWTRRLDREKITAAMGKAWVERFVRATVSTVVRVAPKRAAGKPSVFE